MADFNKYPYFFGEEIKLLASCPLCEADLNPVKAKIVECKEDLNLVHIQCHKCKGFILALVLKTGTDLSSIGLITDLDFNDVVKFKDEEKISADYVIRIYQFLKINNLTKENLKQETDSILIK